MIKETFVHLRLAKCTGLNMKNIIVEKKNVILCCDIRFTHSVLTVLVRNPNKKLK